MTLKLAACQENSISDIHGNKTRKCIETHKENGKYSQRVTNVSGTKEQIKKLYGDKVEFLDF